MTIYLVGDFLQAGWRSTPYHRQHDRHCGATYSKGRYTSHLG
jgi:hypothetical protein